MKKVNLLVLCVWITLGLTACKGKVENDTLKASEAVEVENAPLEMTETVEKVENDPLKMSEAVIKYINKGDFKALNQFKIDDPRASFDFYQEVYDNPEKYEREYKGVKNLVDGEFTLKKNKQKEKEAMIEYRYVCKSSKVKNTLTMRFEKRNGTWYLIYI